MNKLKLHIILFLLSVAAMLSAQNAPTFISYSGDTGNWELTDTSKPISILMDENEYSGVQNAILHLQNDIEMVTGKKSVVLNSGNQTIKIIVGTYNKNKLINKLVGKVDLEGKYEKFIIQTIENPADGVEKALVIAGSDMRGTIYGIYELSRQMGVSPWYYWADVPVRKSEKIFIKPGKFTAGEPAVKYRGIFLNDEAPALSGWSKATFGGFNHLFYEKVFELILRLKGNFIWPAMWGNAFYDDDPENGPLADKMGIVIGTSHHEPMGRAHAEWSKYGTGKWDYSKNQQVLAEFWRSGFERMKNYETVVTLGMRGDGDEPMSEESNIKLLEKIVKEQRNIIKKVSGKKITETPQVWALYKEVQDYYDKGMRVPDDVTLLFCDDNWGNVRKLPDPAAKAHKGGYGMYYHFDYVGGPRNYKWINVSQIQRIWEQMNLTYSHGVDRIWIVNVGDLKPMEYPISFFLDMAWNPAQFNSQNLLSHTEKWCAAQFGEKYSKEAARLIDTYTKYSRRITPELLNDTIYSLKNYNEFETVMNDFRALALDAFRLYQQIPAESRDAFDQLVLFPINAFSNLYEMYFAVAKNKELAKQNNPKANFWADKVKACFDRDSLLTVHYNTVISGGKWAHMMDQVRIGYTYWQQPERSVMPAVVRVEPTNKGIFTEKDGYISMEAANFSRKNESANVRWEIIPNLGKTLSGITTFPQNYYPNSNENIYLEYDFQLESEGEFPVYILVSPTLNFNENKGLRYAVSVDGQQEQIVNINDKYDVRKMERWQAKSINQTITKHNFNKKGKHTLRFRVLEPGIVLQKIMIDTGGLKPSYLGAPESIKR
ncbi:MAG TPA: glycosyl hydrolase 115 family protein [Paludibacteraceae bacterium]|nr:glycosyl hydrolase 115 family protein [Paludibacteraceae bacterium]